MVNSKLASRTQLSSIPVRPIFLKPVPENPIGQEHSYDRNVSEQIANGPHSSKSLAHSSMAKFAIFTKVPG